MSASEKAIQTTVFSILGNLFLAIFKLITGILGNTYALIADAIESFTDVLSSFLVFFGLKYAQRPADENHPYGHGKIEPLITFFVVVIMVISATIIAYTSILNIYTPHQIPKPWTLFILGGIVIWKEISFQYVYKKSKETNSDTLKADAWHHRSDAISSLAAFIGICFSLYLGKGYEAADDWAALFAAAFILYNCFGIVRPALGEIMDEHLYDDLIKEIRLIATTVKGVEGTEKCFIRKAGTQYHVDLHCLVNATITVREGHDISHDLKNTLMDKLPNVCNVLIHIEPIDL